MVIIGDIVSVVGVFFVVVFIIYLSWLFSKYVGAGAVKMGQSKHMNIIDKIMLGQDRFLLIVQIGKEYYFIGVSGGGMQMMAKLSECDITLAKDMAQNVTEHDGFKNIITKLMEKTKKDK